MRGGRIIAKSIHDSPSTRSVLVVVFAIVVVIGTLPLAGATAIQFATNDDATILTEEGDTLEGTTDEIDGTTNETDDDGDALIEENEDELDEVNDEIEGELEETEDDVDDTVEETEETLDDTVEETDDEISHLVNESAESLEETVDETIAAGDELTDSLEDTVERSSSIADETDTTDSESLIEVETEFYPIDSDHAARHQQTSDTPPEEHDITSESIDGDSAIASSDENETPVGTLEGANPTADDGVAPPETAVVGTIVVLFGSLVGVAAGSSTGAVTFGGKLSSASLATRTGLSDVVRAGVERYNRPRFLTVAYRYSRYDDSDPLDHDQRRALYTTIVENPGSYLSELETTTDLSLSTVRHHLRVLEEENLIETEKIRGKRRFSPVGAVDVTLRAALAEEATRRLLETLDSLGRARNDRLADELDLDPSTISHHLVRLEEANLVVRESDGRAVVNRLAPSATDFSSPDA